MGLGLAKPMHWAATIRTARKAAAEILTSAWRGVILQHRCVDRYRASRQRDRRRRLHATACCLISFARSSMNTISRSVIRMRASVAVRSRPLRRYLELAERAYAGESGLDSAWNFGPDESSTRTVGEVIRCRRVRAPWAPARIAFGAIQPQPHEATLEARHLKARAHSRGALVSTCAKRSSGPPTGIAAIWPARICTLTRMQLDQYMGAPRRLLTQSASLHRDLNTEKALSPSSTRRRPAPALSPHCASSFLSDSSE